MKRFFVILSVIALVLVLASCEKPEEVVYDSGEFLVQLSVTENEDEEEVIAHIIGQSTSDSSVEIPNSVDLDDVAKKFGSSGSYKVTSVEGLSAETVTISTKIYNKAKLDLAGKKVIQGNLKYRVSDDGKELTFLGTCDNKRLNEKVPPEVNLIPVTVSGTYSGMIWAGYPESHKDKDFDFNHWVDMIDKELKFMVLQHDFQEVLLKRRQQVIEDRIDIVGNDTVEFTPEEGYTYDPDNKKGKWVEIDLSDQVLTMHSETSSRYFKISTGKSGRETPTGEFPIITRLKLHTMVGADENGDNEPDYIQEDVPWCTKFTDRGHYIHGAYWHNNFGNVMSHGCVNMKPADAKVVYDFLADVPLNEKNVIVVHE